MKNNEGKDIKGSSDKIIANRINCFFDNFVISNL